MLRHYSRRTRVIASPSLWLRCAGRKHFHSFTPSSSASSSFKEVEPDTAARDGSQANAAANAALLQPTRTVDPSQTSTDLSATGLMPPVQQHAFIAPLTQDLFNVFSAQRRSAQNEVAGTTEDTVTEAREAAGTKAEAQANASKVPGRPPSRKPKRSAKKKSEPKDALSTKDQPENGVKKPSIRRISGRKRIRISKSASHEPSTPVLRKMLSPEQIVMEGLKVEQPPVKQLCHELDRVLFMQGVYNLQDPRTGVYNFDRYLQTLMPIEEFDFESLAAFIPSGEDKMLHNLAKEHKKRYIGSTSSITGALSQFHFLLSNFRPLHFARVSSGFPKPLNNFTALTQLPTALYLSYQDGVYALNADKTYDRETILSQMGRSMEKLLLLPPDEFERYRLSNPEKVPEEDRNAPETYHYSTLGNFLFRAQLDGYHEYLPGSGIFDIKTRACVTIRMNQDEYETMSNYQIRGLYGEWESYEREYVDMMRSAMLKYSLQVRLGRMDGIFVAFHNTDQIFGFQYIPLSEMDLAIHGQENLALGDQEFKVSMQMLSDILDMITKECPEKSVRLHIETVQENGKPKLHVFAEPMDAQTIVGIQAEERALVMRGFKKNLDESNIEQDSDSSSSTKNNRAKIDERNKTGSSSSKQATNLTKRSIPHKELDLVKPDLKGADDSLSTHTASPSTASVSDNSPNRSVSNTFFDQSYVFTASAEIVTHKHMAGQPNEPVYQGPSSVKDNKATDSDLDPFHVNDVVHSAMLDSDLSAPAATSDELDKQNVDYLESAKADEILPRPLLAFTVTVKHQLDGKQAKDVRDFNYLGPWPLPAENNKEASSSMAPPPTNKIWTTEYDIVRLKNKTARELYLACKQRRYRKFKSLFDPRDPRDRALSGLLAKWSDIGRHRKAEATRIVKGTGVRQATK